MSNITISHTHATRMPRSAGALLASITVAAALALGCFGLAHAQDNAKAAASSLSLITETPEAGFALAIKLSQKGVASVQTDPEVRKELRPDYSHDPDSLIAVSHVIATHFQTIAAANDYWRQ